MTIDCVEVSAMRGRLPPRGFRRSIGSPPLCSRFSGVREFSVPPVVTIGDHSSLIDPIWDNAAEAPDAVQFARRIDGVWHDVTCAQFLEEVVAVARGLLAAGIEPGDRVGLMSKTRYEWTL